LAARREEYFALLARQFPTLCLHDEFIFFPRLSTAWEHWFIPAQLEASALDATASRLMELLSRINREMPPAVTPAGTPDCPPDLVLLRQSLTSVLRELSPGGPWERDPFLYLKVASLALAPVLAQAPQVDWRDAEKLAELLDGLARLFSWGRRQVRTLTLPAQLLLAGAFADARQFFQQVVPAFLAAHYPGSSFWPGLLRETCLSLKGFQESLAQLPATAPTTRGEAALTDILSSCWGWNGDLKTAAALLREEVDESRAALQHWATRVRPGPWTAALAAIQPPAGGVDLLNPYRREVARLWDFWPRSGLLPPVTGRVVVAETPVYLKTLRSSASYAAPWGPPDTNPGYFYVTPEIEDVGHHFRHHRFLSAHETVPGHHLLDATRLSLPSPMARQYESPLFYEGWACYGETLLLSAGYLQDPRDYLVGWQRRLWRALRGLADLELQRGRCGLEESFKCLRQAGYPENTARLQVLQLALNPGYQLCYTLGLKELLRLKENCGPRMGLARFHELVLSGGQLPFGLVESNLRGGPGEHGSPALPSNSPPHPL
jgi:hypothetical protein